MQNKFLDSVHGKQQVIHFLVFADLLLFGNSRRGFSFPVFLIHVLFFLRSPVSCLLLLNFIFAYRDEIKYLATI